MRKREKIMDRLDAMLSDALNGTFEVSGYDETELSRFESKFQQYISAKEVSEEKLSREREAIKSLVSDISHQTKTPLSNVLLYAQLLEERCNDEELKPYVQQIRMQAEKLQFLIRSLIRLSRLESGMIEPEPKEQLLAPLLEEAVGLAVGKASEKNITIRTEQTEEIKASYDLHWTLEALGNILDNAIKYSPKRSRITVSVRALEMFACITVKDEGPGILEEEQAQIFERFYRGKNAASQEGNGIGLYLSRMILQKEKGYIRVSSNEEKGSSFHIYLMRA